MKQDDRDFDLKYFVAYAASDVRPSTPRIRDEPFVRLYNWRIMKSDRDSLHFIGECERTQGARASSRIVQLNIDGLVGVTRSGRVYQFVGPSRVHERADALWEEMCIECGFASSSDVTAEIAPPDRVEQALSRRDRQQCFPVE